MAKFSVLITGANSGFGKRMAITFARAGYHVYATARNLQSEGVGEINSLIDKEKLSLEWLKLDVTKQEQITSAYEAIKDRGLDILINNAGYGILGPIDEYTVDDFERQFDTNFFGVVRTTYTFLPLLKKSAYPKIITISSIAGLIVAPAYGLYASSKHAVEVFIETLSYELYNTNIKVVLIEPGGFDTNFSANGKGLNAKPLHESASDEWYYNVLRFRNTFIGTDTNIKNKARDPQRVADLALAIARKKNPRLRYIIGQGAFFGHVFRKLLPAGAWGGVMRMVIKYFSRR
jgi:NAD(P)-dependent dehydrogenase (short-subunit alcohol dehydrogenase family)